ncbi:hypothetical protein [Nocardioides sp. TF02-7]|uniref:hypothetical protein n=1 Tax=Nocardioides sp. TF02-7 TaxID=2917724 RepID=UPI001F065EB3|nr:hypothetical protein [Nocardioides sp. TF02-7]UMG92509.1 hypothetical protein MF408_22210 [Nocardioides sp. TF02-7]
MEERAHGEQQPEPTARRLSDEQRGVHEPVQHVDRVAGAPHRPGQRLGRAQVHAAGERGQRAEQRLVVDAEEPVGRVDGGPQRALAVVVGTPPGRQVERPVEPLPDGTQRHHRHLPRGELDAEREAVEAVQHLDQVVGVGGGHREVGTQPTGVLGERPHPRLPPQRPSRSPVSRGTGNGCNRTTYSPGAWSDARDVASTSTPGPPGAAPPRGRGTRRRRARSCRGRGAAAHRRAHRPRHRRRPRR